MTSLESFEKWAQKTLDSFPDENERKEFDKARTEMELELAVKKVLKERYQEHLTKKLQTHRFV